MRLHDSGKSRKRYLHISCHASKVTIGGEALALDKFSDLLRPHLRQRRVFLSACQATNKALARCMFDHSSCRSLAGPKGKPRFRDSVLMWGLFYNLVFRPRLKEC